MNDINGIDVMPLNGRLGGNSKLDLTVKFVSADLRACELSTFCNKIEIKFKKDPVLSTIYYLKTIQVNKIYT